MLGIAQPVSPEAARPRPSVDRVCSPPRGLWQPPVCLARARHGPSTPRPASFRRWGPPRGSRPSPTAPHGSRRPLALLAGQPPGPAAAADPGPLGPSHGEPPALFPEPSTAPPPGLRLCPWWPPPVWGLPGSPEGWSRQGPGSPVEPPGGTRRALPFVTLSGRGDGGGVRGRGGLKLLLTSPPSLNAGWGAGGPTAGLCACFSNWKVGLSPGKKPVNGGGGWGTAARGAVSCPRKLRCCTLGRSARRPRRVRPGFARAPRCGMPL